MGETHVRIGIGYDVHRLVDGRPLILGGVTIAHPRGLLGHSDADVLLHAVTDALLGAAGLGDIGTHFPPADPAWKDADSRVLLRAVVAMLHRAGWGAFNVDATIVCEQPKIGPHAAAMRRNIAEDLGIGASAANIKGKTSEGLGFTGTGEGIAAYAVVTIRSLAEV